jgi:ClpX C4-type zinc finger
MISFEIWIDNKKICIAGHEQAIVLHTSLALMPGGPNPHLSVTGSIQSQPNLIEENSWVSSSVPVGSEVLIKVVDSEIPTSPTKVNSAFGTRLHPSHKELFCSFCARNQKDVEFMCEGMGGNICNECVETCLEACKSRRVD